MPGKLSFLKVENTPSISKAAVTSLQRQWRTRVSRARGQRQFGRPHPTHSR